MLIDKQTFYVLRVDSGLRDIVKEGNFDDCMRETERLYKIPSNRIYIIREMKEALKNIKENNIL